MPTFAFKAHDITTRVVDKITDANSTVVVTTPLTVDPISDAINNVRFAVNGFAADGSFAAIDLRTRAFFNLKVRAASTIQVHGHLTFFGLSSVTGRRKSWLFDWAGFAGFSLRARMRVRIQRGNTTAVTVSSPEVVLFSESATGSDFTRTNTDVVVATILERFLTVSPPDVVLPSDEIHVRLQYNVTAFALDGGEFVVDFDAANAGLNVPMVVMNAFS
jgi:hypothetical protein